MAIGIQLEDAGGEGTGVRVLKDGQLVTGPLDFSTSSSQKMEVVDTAYNYIAPTATKTIIITGILLYANKSVGVGDATVTIYTSSVGPDTTTVTQEILTTEMLKNTARDLIGLNIEVAEGQWVNGKTDDDDIFCTILYYYAPAVR